MNTTAAAAPPRIQIGVTTPHPAIAPAPGAQARLQARAAGVLWLMVIVTSMFGLLLQSPLTVRGDAAATAAKLVASEGLYRLGFTANLAGGVFYLGVTVLLYLLLKPAGRSVSLLAGAFGVAGVTVGAAASLLSLVPLALLNGADALGGFTDAQVQGLAYTFLGIGAPGFQVGMLFFGVQCGLAGWLITRSTFLPRVLGVLLGVGGASYVISSMASLLSPAFGAQLTPFIIPAALIGEGSLTVWLMAKGVDGARWQEQAARQ
jgi:hypothetical protein